MARSAQPEPARKRSRRPTSRCPSRRATRRSLPDPAFLHQPDLLLDDFLAIVGVTAWNAVDVTVLGIDRLLVDQLRQLGANVLHPIGDLRRLPVMAQRLDIDRAGDE